MKLRSRIVLRVILALGVAVIVFAVFHIAVLQKGLQATIGQIEKSYLSLEQQEAQTNAERVEQAIRQQIQLLASKSIDWAQWDDAWHYAQNKNPSFIARNINKETLLNLETDFLGIFDTTGTPIYMATVSQQSADTTQLPKCLDSLANHPANKKLLEEGKQMQGMLACDTLPFIFATTPITQTNGDGPVHGSIIFGAFLDSLRLHNLSQQVQIPLHLQVSQNATEQIHEQSQDTLSYLKPWSDIHNQTAFQLQLLLHRKLLQQGKATIQQTKALTDNLLNINFVAVLILILITVFILGATIDSVVLSRLALFSKQAVEIAQNRAFDSRLQNNYQPGKAFTLLNKTYLKDELDLLAGSANMMLDSLEAAHKQVLVNSHTLRLIFDSLPIAIFKISEDMTIGSELSRFAQKKLGAQPGMKFADIFKLDSKTEQDLHDFLEVLPIANLPMNEMDGLNPLPHYKWTDKNNTKQWVRIRFRPMFSSGNFLGTLAIVEDISQLRTLQKELDESSQQAGLLRAILEEPQTLFSIYEDTEQLYHALLSFCMAPRAERKQQVSNLLQTLHTLKGTTATLGMQSISRSIATIEQNILAVRDGESGDPLLISVQENAHALFTKLQHAKTDLHYWQELINTNQSLQHFVPAKNAFARLERSMPQMAQFKQKQAKLLLQGDLNYPIAIHLVSTVNDILLHLLRNAIAHGIEAPTTRIEHGKPETGVITITITSHNNALQLRVEDDGAGMDWLALNKQAQDQSIDFTIQSENDMAGILKLLCHPGFSTSEQTDFISGAGVGLQAVACTLHKIGGTITVHTKQGKGTAFILNIPLHTST
jgi:sensor domain CHASE-containing protein/signal transduction histidine kinase